MIFDDYRIEIIPDTEFRLDGGSMFGVVPRVLWERKTPPDDLNRIRLNMNCLFIETPDERILIETGIGEKWSEKETQIYGIFRQKPFAETLFEKTGCKPEDISIVVNTHLHFDHAGGNTSIADRGLRNADLPDDQEEISDSKFQVSNKDKSNPQSAIRIPHSIVPQFPNARYYVSASEFEAAENPHERDRASYLPENWRPLQKSGQLELKPDNYEVVAGLTMQTVRGHSATMQTVKLQRGGKTLYGFADLIPTTAHLSLPWIMGYDLFPTETLEAKRQLLAQAVKEDWICLFYHDFKMPLCRLENVKGKMKPKEI